MITELKQKIVRQRWERIEKEQGLERPKSKAENTKRAKQAHKKKAD